MPARRSALPILFIVFHACSERAPASADPAARVAGGEPPAAAIAPTDTTPAAPTDDFTTAFALDGEGLRVIRLSSGATRLVPFGEARSVVIAMASRLLHAMPPKLTENLDCPATVATWPASELQLWFTSDAAARFVGWSLGGRAPADSTAPALTTMSGIGLGSTRAALESVYVARIARSSLGVEFSAAGIAGLLDSAQPNAAVQTLWAGQVCLAR